MIKLNKIKLFIVFLLMMQASIVFARDADLYMDFETSTSGTAITTSILGSSTHGTGVSSWMIDGSSPADTGTISTSASSSAGSVTVGSTTYSGGTRGLAIDHYYAPEAYIAFFSANHANVSVGFDVTFGPDNTSGSINVDMMFLSNSTNYRSCIFNYQSGTFTPTHRVSAHDTQGGGINGQHGAYFEIVPGTAYWATMKKEQGVACSVSVYDKATMALVGTSVLPTANYPSIALGFGHNPAYAGTSDHKVSYIDNIIVDWTTASFPLLPTPGCSGSGLTWSCSAGATVAQVQAAVNNASDGATITFADGAYTWSSTIDLSPARGITLKGSSSTVVTPTGTIIRLVNNTATNNKLYRITGFTFDSLSGTTTGMIRAYGTYDITGIRIDHNSWTNIGDNQWVFMGGNSGGNYGVVYGVIDNNTVSGDYACTFAFGFGYGGVATDAVWPANRSGTVNNLFIENNTLTFKYLNAIGHKVSIGDSWAGGAMVWRYNTITNGLISAHGTVHQGGTVNFEAYENSITITSDATHFLDGYSSIHHHGSGEQYIYNNTITTYTTPINAEVFRVNDYRAYLDHGDGDRTELGRCDGENAIDGNTSPTGTYYGYPCWHQAARDKDGNLRPLYIWNNVANGSTQINLAVSNSYPADAPPAPSVHVAANRDYYNAVSASAQTSPTSPFNGTTGMGFGTLANRPTTCTTGAESGGGVGYFATDQGAQGVLYRCSATGWVTQYTPYDYPHPLSGGAPPADTTAPSVAITQSSPQTINTNSLAISGTASDAVGVTSCKYRIGSAPNASYGTLLTGTTTWSGTAVGFSLGANTLYIGCGDAAGNWGSSSITVNYTDIAAPVVTFTTTSPQSTTKNLLPISGTATDNIGVSSCKYRVGSVPDATHGTALTGTTSWSGNATGFLGETNTLYVGCTDSTGNWGSSYITVNYYPSSIVWGKISGVSEADIRSFSTWTIVNGTIINAGLDTERVSLTANGYMVSGVVTTGLVGVRLNINKYTSAVNQTVKYKTAVDDVFTGATWTTYSGKFNSLGFVKLCVTVGGGCGE